VHLAKIATIIWPWKELEKAFLDISLHRNIVGRLWPRGLVPVANFLQGRENKIL